MAGWGSTKPNTFEPEFPDLLQEVKVPIRDLNKCRNNYFVSYAKYMGIKQISDLIELVPGQLSTVYDKMNLCAGGDNTDSCSVRNCILNFWHSSNFWDNYRCFSAVRQLVTL